MKFVKISSMIHVSSARSIFYKIFPEEIGRNNCKVYTDSVNHHLYGCNRLEYYILMEKVNGFSKPIGLTGIYSVNLEEAWLGWFGIIPEMRNKGYGTQMLVYTLVKMTNYKYKTALLYTEKKYNQDAIKLYLKSGFKEGKSYEINDKEAKVIGDYQDKSKECINTIYFKSLDGRKLEEWNGKPVF